MSPILPRELIDLCIAASRDCLPTLLQFSLVSKQCASEARKYAFKEINLDRRDRAVGAYSCYIQKLLNLLESNRMLENYVRALVLPLEPSIYTTSEVYTEDILTILKHFTSLTTLSITPRDVCDWETLPDSLKQSISLSCSAPSIISLNFSNFLNFPGHLVQSALNLKFLTLTNLITARDGRSQSGPPAGCGLRPRYEPRLEKLQHLTCYITNQEDFNFCCRIMRECAGSLRVLRIAFLTYKVIHNSPIHLGDMIDLRPVVTLRLSSSVEVKDHGVGTIALGRHLPLFLDILQFQRNAKEFIIDIRVYNSRGHGTDSELPPAILPNCEAWKAMDEYLSSEKTTSPKRTFLNFYTIGWGSRPTTDDRYRVVGPEQMSAFENRLLSEAREVLHRAIDANRLSIAISEGRIPALATSPRQES
ncbi:hypothetical protein D9611_014184 [Ephemerocybe angulata]|uniref:Uncharacterized protein n=1 Tax=Ephemerocybe angulata TaxID=980116 RepID=A0A8H5FIQ8_9AGAR|nr:hypothetical protein D9611_014184 [Tulosesus angulatus]